MSNGPNRIESKIAGHDAGAANWACLASLIETAKIHGVDRQPYRIRPGGTALLGGGFSRSV
jgi:hypothetical protein